eukprot:6293603-Prymnesium_polylepis.1
MAQAASIAVSLHGRRGEGSGVDDREGCGSVGAGGSTPSSGARWRPHWWNYEPHNEEPTHNGE